MLETDHERAAAIVRMGFGLLALFARISSPFIPRMAAALGEVVGSNDTDWPTVFDGALPA